MSFLAGPSRSTTSTPTTVTYRHLLSPAAQTVFNPLRTIAHCDIDAAYAQFEQVRLGLSPEIPLICAQWQSIIAVNYPARKYGIKRFNTIDEAKKMCPHLVVQHVATYRNGEAEAGYWGEADPRTHKVSLDPYRRESLKILAIFKDMIPKGEIEKASIDEAFLDLTGMSIERLLAYHPHLLTVPEDAPEGLDTPLPPAPPIDWVKAGNVVPINPGQTGETGAAEGINEGGTESAGVDTWEDWALLAGAEIMAEVRAAVYDKLQYTCSAGIAHSKAMAKLCSAWKKPNQQTVLRAAATPAFLRDMDFTDIRMLGGKLGTSIATEFNAKTVGDLLDTSLEDMQKRFGEESIWVYNIIRVGHILCVEAHDQIFLRPDLPYFMFDLGRSHSLLTCSEGIDHSEVTARVATKSMLASKNTRPPVTTPEQGVHWLKILSGELCVRLRESREIAPGLWPKTLVLGHRTGIESGRHRQIPFPFTRNLNTEYILKFAKRLWEEVCQPMSRGGMKLNNMSLSFAGLERMEEGQRGIEGFFGAPNGSSATNSKPMVQEELNITPRTASPAKRDRAGPFTSTTKQDKSDQDVPPAKAIQLETKRTRLPPLHTVKKRGLDTFFGTRPATAEKNGESSTANAPSSIPQATGEQPGQLSHEAVGLDGEMKAGTAEAQVDADGPSISRPEGSWKCPKCGITLQLPLETSSDATETNSEAKLPGIIQEHEDYHFALDLEKHGSSPMRARGLGRTSKSTKDGAHDEIVSGQSATATGVGKTRGADEVIDVDNEDDRKSSSRGNRGNKKLKSGPKGGIKAFFAPKSTSRKDT